jgi:hypothetical protein
MSLPDTIPGLLETAQRLTEDWYRAGAVVIGQPDIECRDWMREIQVKTWLRLLCDLSRSESRDFWLRWLSSGERCPDCIHLPLPDPDPAPEWTQLRCPACAGSGWTRLPYDCNWMRDNEKHHYDQHTLTSEESAAFVSWSVQSVAEGEEPLIGYMLPWQRYEKSQNTTYSHSDGEEHAESGWARTAVYVDSSLKRLNSQIYGQIDDISGWRICMDPRGPEAGDEGRIVVDSAFLCLGLALLETNGVIRLPELPFRYNYPQKDEP